MKPLLPLLAATLVSLTSANPAGAGCQIYHRPHYVQPVVQQVVYFSVGDNLRIEAAVEKALAKREAQQGTLQQRAPAQSTLAEKCARCHSGEAAKGGYNVNEPASDYQFSRVVEILSGYNVPSAMKGVVDGMQPADKGAVTEEVIRKRLAKPAAVKEPEEGILR